MAYEDWETIDGVYGQDGCRELSSYGELALVITRAETRYEWSLRVDNENGAVLREGATEPHESFDRKDGSRDAACEAVHSAAHSLMRGLKDDVVSDLLSLKASVPGVRAQAYTRGAEHGAREAAAFLRKKAAALRATALALDEYSREVDENADVLAQKCRDPYEGK